MDTVDCSLSLSLSLSFSVKGVNQDKSLKGIERLPEAWNHGIRTEYDCKAETMLPNDIHMSIS